MTPEEIKRFKKEVADPALEKLFQKTKLVDGLCFVDELNISYIDDRSWGTDSAYEATGFVYSEGSVHVFKHELYDVSFKEFSKGLNNCSFITNGTFTLNDENNEMHISSTIRSADFLIPIYPDLEPLRELNYSRVSIEYLKMKHIYASQCEKVKEWYCKTYPGDDVGPTLNEDISFEDVYSALKNGSSAYEVLGGYADSVVRERIFERLAQIKEVEYKDIYGLWMDQNKQPIDIQINSSKPKTEIEKGSNDNSLSVENRGNDR